MNSFQLSYLAAKDYLVAKHKWNIRLWEAQRWWTAVDDIASHLRHSNNTDWMKPYE